MKIFLISAAIVSSIFFGMLVRGQVPIQTPYLLPAQEKADIKALRDLAYDDRQAGIPWEESTSSRQLVQYADAMFLRMGLPSIHAEDHYLLDAKCGVLFSSEDVPKGLNFFYADRNQCLLK